MDSEVFQAVLDESGYEAADSNYRDDVFVFAGYIGKLVDWAAFTHAWQRIIDTHPELQEVEFVKGLMRWKGRYSDPRAVDLVKSVIENNGLASIRWRLPYKEYRKVVVTHALGSNENIYVFAWFAVLMMAIGIISAMPGATLDLIYDQNIFEEPKVQTGYERLRKWLEKNYPDVAARVPCRPHPKSDTQFWPLRAADALAWNTHRHYIRTHRRRAFGNPLWRLLDSGPIAMDATWTAEDVRDVLRPNQPMESGRRIKELWQAMTRQR